MATSLQRFKSIVGTEDLNKYKQKQEIVKHGTVTGKASYPVYVDNREEDKDDEDKPSLLERAGLTLRGSARQVSGGLNTTGTMIGSYIGKAAERLGIGPDREEASDTLKDLERSYAAAELMLRQDPSDNAARRQKATLEPIIDYYRSKAEGSSESYVDKWYRDQIDKQQNVTLKGAADIERAKEGLGTVGRYAVDVGAGLSQMGMNAVLGFGNIMPSMIASAVGNSAGEALDEGASMNQAMVYGGLVGAVEGVAEKLFSPGKILKGISGRGLADKAVDRIVGNVAFNSINSNAGRALIKGLVDVGIAGTEEGAEEVLVSVLNPILKNIVYSDGEEIDIKEALYAGLVGFGTGGVLGGPGRIMERTARDRSIEAVVSNNQVDRIAPTETDPFSHVSETSETSANQRIAEKDSRRRLDPVKESTVNKLLKKVEGNDQKTGRSFANSIEGIARIKNVVNTLGESGAKALGEFYDGESDFDSFYAGFSRYYEAGTSNLDIDKVNTDFSKYISPGVKVAAHSAGVNDAKASLEKDINISKNATIFGNGNGGINTEGNKGAFVEAAVSSGKIKQSTVNDLDKLGKQFGVKIHLVDHIGAGMNGFYDKGEITIALDSSDPFMTVASHEVTHHMQKASPKEYRAYRDYAISFFANKDGGSPSTVVQKKIQTYKAFGVDITEEGAMDEIAAEFAESLFNDELILKDFIGKADKSIVKRFFEAIKAFLKKIKGLGKAEQESLAQREYGATVSELERAVELWEASAKATQGRAKELGDRGLEATDFERIGIEPGDVQYSLSYRNATINQEILALVGKVKSGKFKAKEKVFLGTVSPENAKQIYEETGIDVSGYRIAIEARQIEHILIRHGENGKQDNSMKNDDDIAKMEFAMEAPDNITYAGRTSAYWYSENSQNKTAHTVLYEKQVGEESYYVVQAVPVAKAKTLYIVTAFRGKQGYKAQKKEASQLNNAKSPAATSKNATVITSNNSKPQEAEIVKKQYSLKDSNGRTLTKGQQEYFKDSKVRDEAGNLLVMYHGTPNAGFNEFRSGSYFTQHREWADVYQSPSASSISTGKSSANPDTYAVYLNIKKPFDTRNLEERRIFEEEFYRQWGTGTPLTEKGLPDWTDGMDLQEFIEENGYDYDGLILDEGAVGGYGEEVVSRGLSYVTFSPEQIKNIDNENPTSDPDIRFSIKKPVEESKNLIALHNVRQNKLEEALKLGGLPAPSIAITKTDIDHDNFGEISLVFRKDTINPTNRKNKIYSGDAWTPTRVRVEYDVDDEVVERFNSKIRELTPEWGDERLPSVDAGTADVENDSFAETYSRKERARMAFLKEKGKAPKTVMREPKLSSFASNNAIIAVAKAFSSKQLKDIANNTNGGYDQYRNAFVKVIRDNAMAEVDKKFPEGNKHREKMLQVYTDTYSVDNVHRFDIERTAQMAAKIKANRYKVEKVVDVGAIRDRINKKFTKKLEEEFKLWVDENTKGAIVNKGIRNNRDLFTPSGSRRSFAQLHDPYTASNIVRNMFAEAEKGIGAFGGSPIGAAQYEFESIADVKAASDRLRVIDQDEYLELERQINDDTLELVRKMVINSDVLAIKDLLAEAIAKPTKQQADSYLKREAKGWAKYSPEFTDELWDIKKRINNMPTGYFEAKPQRVVGFDEVVLAVIPKGMKNLKAKLEELGVQAVKYYDKNKDGDRQNKVNSVPDVRFSIKGGSNLKDILKENERLKKQRDFLQEQLKISKEIKQDKKAVKKLAKEFLDLYDSRMDPDELIADLETMFGYLANERTPVWGDIMSMARQTAGKVVKESVAVDEDMYSLYTSLRDYLKSQRITLSKDYRDDIPDYNEFRKANIGRLVLVNDGGTPVDVLYERLSDMFPEYFAYDNHKDNPADQLLHIEEVLNELQGYEYNNYDSNMQQAVEELALNLINRYYDIPQAKTYADKQAEKLTKAKIRGAFDLADERERSRERVAKLRERYYSDIKDLKDHQKEKESKMSSDRKARIVRAKIMRHITPMRQKLLRPTDNKNVPKELRTIVATILDAINLESNYTVDPHTGKARKGGDGLPTKRTEAFLKLREEYQRIISEEGSDFVLDPSLLGDAAAGVESLLDKVIGMRDLKLADMNLEQVEAVWQVLKAVESSISHAGKMLAYGKNKTTKSVALDFQNDTKDRRDKNSFTRRHYMIDMETPYTFFSHFGNAGKTFFRMLRNAQDKEQLLQLELAEKVQKIVSKENRKKYEKDLTEFTTENGDKLILGKDHIMELYLLSKRTQAEGHLMNGGIYQPEINRRTRRGTDPIQLTEADLENLFSHLNSQEKKVADGFQELTGFLAENGNEVTLQLYGYEKFTDPNYWPIKSASEGITQDVDKGVDMARSIRNMGAAKPTVPKASNALELRGIFNTFDAHASEMICYASWLAPMEDANRLFNYKYKNDDGKPTGKTMKGLLNRVAGAGADKYWLNLMGDIQNGIKGKTDESFTAVFNKVYGNVRGASVASNIRVIAQQPTAFLRAGIVLSPHNMSLGMAKGATKGNGWKKALKYAPIAQRKKIGGFEVSASPAQLAEVLYEPDTGMGKAKQVAKDLPFWGASKADQVTWGMIWNACEWQIAGKRKDLPKGSESFYTAVTELFNDVIEQSQVVDGVLQRAQIMRSSSTFMKQSTAYMGEPIMSFNLLMRNYDAFRRENDPKKRSAARKTLGRCAMVLIISNIAVAIAQSAVDALRDDDEEKEYEERFITALTGITGDEETAAELAKNILLGSNIGNTMNLATYIPILKDGVSILQGYSVERMDASAFGDFLTALTNVQKSFSGEGKWTKGYSIAKMLTTGGKLLGSSAYNIMRDVESIFRSYFIETDDWEALYDMQKQIYDVENQKSRFMDIAYQALKSGDMEAYDAIVADLIENGVDGSDIQSAMRSRATDDKSSNLALSGFNATLAAAGISYKDPVEADREADDDEKVRVENLDGETYVEYMHIKEDMLNEIMSDFKDRGFGDLDEETANNLIEIAYEYVNSVALQEATDGSYEEDAKWINLGYDRLDDVGLSEADYLMLKNKLNHTDAKNENGETVNGLKKKRLVEYMNKFGLTEEQYDFIYHELFDYS